MSLLKPPFFEEEQKIYNKAYFPELKNKELFKAKLDYQKNRMTGDHSSRALFKNKYTIIHSVSTNHIHKGNNKYIPNPLSSERKQNNNLNINVSNSIINNTLNNSTKNIENKNIPKNSSANNVFSRIGNDVVKKNYINYSNPKHNNNIIRLNSLKTNRKKEKFLAENGLENVIDNLIEMTKDKPFIFNMKRNSSNSNLETISKLNIQKEIKERESQLIDNNNFLIDIHFQIWECIFEMENHYDNKNTLLIISKKFLNMIHKEVKNKRKFEIFQLSNFNFVYQKIIKILIILQVYIRFLLLDFNYEITLKTNVKKMISNINDYFLSLILNFVFVKDNLKENKYFSKLNKEFMTSFNLIMKNHKIKKSKEQPFIFGSSMFKNLDNPITTIKTFSNNYFNVGYFKLIHSICIELFRLIDVSTIDEILKIVNVNVLYYITKNNINKKNTNKNSANNFDLNTLSTFGFLNLPPPFLPPLDDDSKNNTYTLVLDLDETLVHFFYTPSGGTFLIRPYCFEFLKKMSTIFEVIIFTAAMKDYADSILDILDPDKNLIKYRLYRQHTSIYTTINGLTFSKDLSKLGRDLNKVIIIDNLSDNFKLQPNNGIAIGTWTENMKDTELMDIGNFLNNLIMKNPEDIRIIIERINQDLDKINKKGNVSPFKELNINNYITN